MEQENEVTSADIKAIESKIEEKIEHINTINNYQEIVEDKKNIDMGKTYKIQIKAYKTNGAISEIEVKEKEQYEQEQKAQQVENDVKEDDVKQKVD